MPEPRLHVTAFAHDGATRLTVVGRENDDVPNLLQVVALAGGLVEPDLEDPVTIVIELLGENETSRAMPWGAKP